MLVQTLPIISKKDQDELKNLERVLIPVLEEYLEKAKARLAELKKKGGE